MVALVQQGKFKNFLNIKKKDMIIFCFITIVFIMFLFRQNTTLKETDFINVKIFISVMYIIYFFTLFFRSFNILTNIITILSFTILSVLVSNEITRINYIDISFVIIPCTLSCLFGVLAINSHFNTKPIVKHLTLIIIPSIFLILTTIISVIFKVTTSYIYVLTVITILFINVILFLTFINNKSRD